MSTSEILQAVLRRLWNRICIGNSKYIDLFGLVLFASHLVAPLERSASWTASKMRYINTVQYARTKERMYKVSIHAQQQIKETTKEKRRGINTQATPPSPAYSESRSSYPCLIARAARLWASFARAAGDNPASATGTPPDSSGDDDPRPGSNASYPNLISLAALDSQ
ncbi:hypothetical protein HMN09_01083400 [Mycena chlorophos]|uniref:Uncharacterized protein n=1 Tax=Mycena chlorophos TaxID=658473 RepID=A0A8H6SBZ5_MYCCL|nr:hypothetical protein HMN09_01083400 [Mycena chlorophos]